jgi:hypothetical protein
MVAIRIGLVAVGIAALVAALGFLEQVAWAVDLWPWPDSRLSFVFLASILAAIALPILWIAVTGEFAAIRGGAANLALVYGGVAIYLLAISGDSGQPDLAPYIVAFGLSCAAMLATLAWSRRQPWRDERPTPALVRGSFAVLAVVLLAVGLALTFDADIFPWELRAESSVIFGFIFLGSAVYFGWGFLQPRWSNAAGQLLGFLAYDVILIGPLLERFGDVSGAESLSLIVYTAVALASGALASYYLMVNPETRLGSGG